MAGSYQRCWVSSVRQCFPLTKKAMWSWIVLIIGVIMLFDALSKALHDPLVWLLAILAVAVIAYRIYRKYGKS